MNPSPWPLMVKVPTKGKAYLKYSGLAFQIVGTILIFVWGGHYLDERLQLSTPWFTLTGAIISITGLMIKLIRSES